jgi:hypothetical protein
VAVGRRQDRAVSLTRVVAVQNDDTNGPGMCIVLGYSDVLTAPQGPQSRIGAHRHGDLPAQSARSLAREGATKREGRAKEEASGICDMSRA